MEDITKDLRIMRNDIEMKKRRLKYKMDDYSLNSKNYNELYIPIFLLSLCSHLIFGSINDMGIAFVDLISMGCMCGSGIAITLANIFYTLPLISYRKEIKVMEKEIKNLDCEIEKKLIADVNKNKDKIESSKLDYKYNSKVANYGKCQYNDVKIGKEVKEQEKTKKLYLRKDIDI